jgi:hypothetical protein
VLPLQPLGIPAEQFLDLEQGQHLFEQTVTGLRRDYLMGAISAVECRSLLAKAGVTPEGVIEYVHEWRRLFTTPHRVATLTEILNEGKDRIITLDEVRRRLRNLGYADDVITNIIREAAGNPGATHGDGLSGSGEPLRPRRRQPREAGGEEEAWTGFLPGPIAEGPPIRPAPAPATGNAELIQALITALRGLQGQPAPAPARPPAPPPPPIVNEFGAVVPVFPHVQGEILSLIGASPPPPQSRVPQQILTPQLPPIDPGVQGVIDAYVAGTYDRATTIRILRDYGYNAQAAAHLLAQRTAGLPGFAIAQPPATPPVIQPAAPYPSIAPTPGAIIAPTALPPLDPGVQGVIDSYIAGVYDRPTTIRILHDYGYTNQTAVTLLRERAGHVQWEAPPTPQPRVSEPEPVLPPDAPKHLEE